MSTHLRNESRKGGDNVVGTPVPVDVVGAQVHCDDIGRVLLQPAHQLLLVGNVDGQKPRVALVVAIVLCVAAVVLPAAGPDEIDLCPLGRLQLVPQLGSPADNLGDGVAKGHVAERGVLCRCARC